MKPQVNPNMDKLSTDKILSKTGRNENQYTQVKLRIAPRILSKTK